MTTTTPFCIALSPQGHPYIYQGSESQETLLIETAQTLEALFEQGYAIGLLRLGLVALPHTLPSSVLFWRKFSQLFLTSIYKICSTEEKNQSTIPHLKAPQEEFNTLIQYAPFMRGSEYLQLETLCNLWDTFTPALITELSHFKNNLSAYFTHYNANWNKVGRVCFHLAENKNDIEHPFAFLATYTTRLSQNTQLQHLPLKRALQEYADKNMRSHLLALLVPVQKAASQSLFIKHLVDSGQIFQPLAWGPREAHQFLTLIPELEACGLVVKVPNWWNPKKPPRPQINVKIGDKDNHTMGMQALLDFDMQLVLPDGEDLSAAELKQLLESQQNLVQIKGQWVEIDSTKLNHVLAHWKTVEKEVKKHGVTFAESLRLLSGVSQLNAATDLPAEEVAQWSKIEEGHWLQEALTKLRHPEDTQNKTIQKILHKKLHATLRPYQQAGVAWLWMLYQLRLGGCLADDMGLGKTIQVLSLLLLAQNQSSTHQTHLLILPASLLGNWQAEIARFAPTLKIWVAHSSATEKALMETHPALSEIDLVITTYALVHRLPWLQEANWDMIIVDEAQGIKNPTTKQTQAIKALHSQVRFILTGTPIENRLLDLWSLFDFVAPGLLGTSKAFADYAKKASKRDQDTNQEGQFYANIRQLVTPYILRRLKTDKKIISDLPDKTELDAYCTLSKTQIALYQQALDELEEKLNAGIEGIQRRGLVLSYLLRFKQICNHPTQWLGHGEYIEKESGKFARLKELCEAISEKQEKVLIFTQFKTIIPHLCAFLANIFGHEGLAIHGQTAVKTRAKLVETFQQEQGPSFFVLSLKAGGTGLNLTNAAHVIHFDRWWNPAVENQATDRAYRIGQKKNVLVHKFICRGTIEEKIDALIQSKKAIADEILAQGSEVLLTEMSNAELLNIVSLDIHRALGET